MRPVLDVISRVGPSDANVLLTGENGTGKGLVAQTLHSRLAARHAAAGHREHRRPGRRRLRKRAVRARQGRLHGRQDPTASAASKWPMAAPCSWTRSPTSRRGCRPSCCAPSRPASSSAWAPRRPAAWMCASSPPPMPTWHAEVAEGRFRQDLLFRLNTIELRLPPLRDRREDIPLLAAHFLGQHAERYRKPIAGFRRGRHEGAAGAPLARQRARTGPRRGARRADGAGRDHPRRRPGRCAPAAKARRAWKK